MDIYKTKKGTDTRQKKFVSRAFDLIRDCSDNYHICFQGEGQTQGYYGCRAFCPQVFQFLWRPSVIVSVSGEKKSWKLIQCYKHFLIYASDFRKSAAKHCSEHNPFAPPPLPHRGLWWHMRDSKALMSPAKCTICWVGC